MLIYIRHYIQIKNLNSSKFEPQTINRMNTHTIYSMKKKGKTRADHKGDAFERLYAILAAGTPGLPALPPAPSAPPVQLPPTQVDKEKEQAEFNKLYAQLAALSSRKKEVVPLAEPLEPLAQVAPLAPIAPLAQVAPLAPIAPLAQVAPVAPIAPKEEQNEFDEIYAQIVRMIAIKTQIEPHVLLPPKKIKPKNDLQCDACCKTFCNSSSIIRHKRLSEACKKWYALPEEEQPPLVTMPIHEMVNEWLERAITGDQPLTCKFCSTTFYNRGNHHKHYQSAQTCNRMAYAEFKRIVAL